MGRYLTKEQIMAELERFYGLGVMFDEQRGRFLGICPTGRVVYSLGFVRNPDKNEFRPFGWGGLESHPDWIEIMSGPRDS